MATFFASDLLALLQLHFRRALAAQVLGDRLKGIRVVVGSRSGVEIGRGRRRDVGFALRLRHPGRMVFL